MFLDWLKKAMEMGKEKTEAETPEELDSLVLKKGLDGAKQFQTDLVEATYVRACCEICAQYRGRIFSVEGKDKRFPRIPADFHTTCGLILSPFIYGVSSPQYCHEGQEISFSNRPFVDDRSAEEKADYKEWALMMERERTKDVDRALYEKLRKALPDETPKSFSAFRRAKNADTAKYQKLIEMAKENGIKTD